MTAPLVSVVLPVFDGETYILEAINSLLEQTFSDFELIIINDGSTDSTEAILDSITDPRLRVLSRENKGISASLNEGIALSKGEYIVRMDSDDVCLPSRLMLQVRYMQENSRVDILGGQAYKVDENGVLMGGVKKPLSTSNIYMYMEYCCPVLHPTYCVRKKVYEELGGYRPIPVEDYDFLLRAKEKKFVIENLPDYIIKYRVCYSGLSLTNPYATMIATSLIKKMHRARVNKRSEEPLLQLLLLPPGKPSKWFSLIFNTRSKLVHKRMKSRGKQKALISVVVALLSLFHQKIFLSSFAIYRARSFVE